MSLRTKAIVAQVGARVLVYGPLIGLAAVFMPIAIPMLALGAFEPYPSRYLVKAASWVASKVPVVGPFAQKSLNRWLGAKWWVHAGALEAGIALAFLHIPFLPGIINTAVVPVLFLTALPLATKLVTKGIDMLPWIKQSAAAKVQRQVEAQAVVEAQAGVSPLGQTVAKLEPPTVSSVAKAGISVPTISSPVNRGLGR